MNNLTTRSGVDMIGSLRKLLFCLKTRKKDSHNSSVGAVPAFIELVGQAAAAHSGAGLTPPETKGKDPSND
jgi:hypothetical protein